MVEQGALGVRTLAGSLISCWDGPIHEALDTCWEPSVHKSEEPTREWEWKGLQIRIWT